MFTDSGRQPDDKPVIDDRTRRRRIWFATGGVVLAAIIFGSWWAYRPECTRGTVLVMAPGLGDRSRGCYAWTELHQEGNTARLRTSLRNTGRLITYAPPGQGKRAIGAVLYKRPYFNGDWRCGRGGFITGNYVNSSTTRVQTSITGKIPYRGAGTLTVTGKTLKLDAGKLKLETADRQQVDARDGEVFFAFRSGEKKDIEVLLSVRADKGLPAKGKSKPVDIAMVALHRKGRLLAAAIPQRTKSVIWRDGNGWNVKLTGLPQPQACPNEGPNAAKLDVTVAKR